MAGSTKDVTANRETAGIATQDQQAPPDKEPAKKEPNVAATRENGKNARMPSSLNQKYATAKMMIATARSTTTCLPLRAV